MTERKRFLEAEEIEDLRRAVIRVFRLDPEDVLLSIQEDKVRIPDPFNEGNRGEEQAQVISFAKDSFPAPADLLKVVVANAIFLGISSVHRMPYASDFVRCAEYLDRPDKLRRIIIDSNLVVLEFQEPLTGWGAARLVRALALGWTAEGIIYDEGDSRWIAARYGYLQ